MQSVKLNLNLELLNYLTNNLFLNKFRSNPKAFYSYVKSKQKVKPSVGPLERSDGSNATCDIEVADELNKYLETTFTQKD